MRKLSIAFALLLPTAAISDQSVPLDHSEMVALTSGPAAGVTEGGQSAFAAIAQIIAMLSADPSTDWSKVRVEALRQHLIDMDNVTLRAVVEAKPKSTGAAFTVTSTDTAIQGSIRRMVATHAAEMNEADGWKMVASTVENGALIVVSGTEADAEKINGIGFTGVLTLGMHHQTHHLMIALGRTSKK